MRGSAAGKGEVLVEQLKAVGDGQEQADSDGRHQVRDLNLPKRLPCRGTVDLGGLDVVGRNGLQTSDVDDHHVADLLPQGQDDKAPEASSRVKGDELGAHVGEQAVNQNLPDVAQHDAADQVRHKEDRTEDVGALERFAGERLRDGEGDHVDEHRRQEGKRHGKEERRGKLRIGQCAHVVLDTDKVRVVDGNKLAEREIETLDKGDHEPDHKRQTRGQHKERPPALECFAHRRVLSICRGRANQRLPAPCR